MLRQWVWPTRKNVYYYTSGVRGKIWSFRLSDSLLPDRFLCRISFCHLACVQHLSANLEGKLAVSLFQYILVFFTLCCLSVLRSRFVVVVWFGFLAFSVENFHLLFSVCLHVNTFKIFILVSVGLWAREDKKYTCVIIFKRNYQVS